MSKTIKNIFFNKLNFFNLLAAHKRAALNKGNKKEILEFDLHLETNLNNLMDSIKSDNYIVGKYSEFKITEPKKRTIRRLPYIDRIVHQWYIGEFIKPYIVNRFINDSYACIEGKGTHKAVYKLQKYMRIMKRNHKDYYIAKFDIKSYFESVDKEILFNILKRYISDKKLLSFTYKLVYESNDKNGIPIGNYTSQYFANIYLNELDYYLKHQLHIKYYIRYMDDFILLLKDKKTANLLYCLIEKFVNSKLKLKLNKKSKIFPSNLGVEFLGYKVFETHILLKKRSKESMKKKIIKFKKGKIDKLDMRRIINSWYGHIKHCNSYNLRCKIEKLIQ